MLARCLLIDVLRYGDFEWLAVTGISPGILFFEALVVDVDRAKLNLLQV
jgi:hypothetical protein